MPDTMFGEGGAFRGRAFTQYDVLRKTVIDYLDDKTFSAAGQKPVPMDLGSLGAGNPPQDTETKEPEEDFTKEELFAMVKQFRSGGGGKSYGKGGPGNPRPKGPCRTCGEMGHIGRDCNKGTGKGNSKGFDSWGGKGFDMKGSGKGKGKATGKGQGKYGNNMSNNMWDWNGYGGGWWNNWQNRGKVIHSLEGEHDENINEQHDEEEADFCLLESNDARPETVACSNRYEALRCDNDDYDCNGLNMIDNNHYNTNNDAKIQSNTSNKNNDVKIQSNTSNKNNDVNIQSNTSNKNNDAKIQSNTSNQNNDANHDRRLAKETFNNHVDINLLEVPNHGGDNGKIFSMSDGADGKWVKEEAVVDSGATDCVTSRKRFPHVSVMSTEESRRGETWSCAGGKTIKKEGQMHLAWRTSEGSRKTSVFKVGAVSKTLISVSRLHETGHDVHLTMKDPNIINRKSGEVIKLKRVRGMFILDMWFWVPGSENQDMEMRSVRETASGFTRQR